MVKYFPRDLESNAATLELFFLVYVWSSFFFLHFHTDEAEEESEEAGPSKTDEPSQQDSAQSEASPSSEGEKKVEKDQESNSEADRGSSTGEGRSACGSTDNNSQDAGEDGEPSTTAETSRKDDEDGGEDDREGAESVAQAKKRMMSRRCCAEKRKKPLFIIQAVNANGNTDRAIGDENSTLSFSSESEYFTLKMPTWLTLCFAIRAICIFHSLISISTWYIVSISIWLIFHIQKELKQTAVAPFASQGKVTTQSKALSALFHICDLTGAHHWLMLL